MGAGGDDVLLNRSAVGEDPTGPAQVAEPDPGDVLLNELIPMIEPEFEGDEPFPEDTSDDVAA